MYQDFPLQDPPKYTQIGIFGLKTNHLATLPLTPKKSWVKCYNFVKYYLKVALWTQNETVYVGKG
jgi:hypothetical protein